MWAGGWRSECIRLGVTWDYPIVLKIKLFYDVWKKGTWITRQENPSQIPVMALERPVRSGNKGAMLRGHKKRGRGREDRRCWVGRGRSQETWEEGRVPESQAGRNANVSGHMGRGQAGTLKPIFILWPCPDKRIQPSQLEKDLFSFYANSWNITALQSNAGICPKGFLCIRKVSSTPRTFLLSSLR